MQHYYHPESRAVTTSWMLAELGVDHESILIDFHAGANHQEEFVAINPMRKVPTLVDGGVVVTEAAEQKLVNHARQFGEQLPVIRLVTCLRACH